MVIVDPEGSLRKTVIITIIVLLVVTVALLTYACFFGNVEKNSPTAKTDAPLPKKSDRIKNDMEDAAQNLKKIPLDDQQIREEMRKTAEELEAIKDPSKKADMEKAQSDLINAAN